MDDKEFIYELLTSDNVVENIRNNKDILLKIIPEITYMVGFEQKNPHHHLDVWEHTLYAISLSDNNFEIRLVLLLHDIGKPFSYQEDSEGIRHYYNHGSVSSNIAYNILNRLEYNEEFINKICYLIKNHDMPITKKEVEENYELAYEKMLIQNCDILAHNLDTILRREKYLTRIKKMFKKDN